MNTPAASRRGDRGDLRLWFAVFVPALAWILAQQLSFVLSPWVCATGRRWVLYLVTGSALCASAAGILAAAGNWRRHATGARAEEDPAGTRRRFMAYGGLLLAAFFTLAILALAIPQVVHRPCD